jgi:hypothetical protein
MKNIVWPPFQTPPPLSASCDFAYSYAAVAIS